MFANTITLGLHGSNVVLTRVNQDNFTGAFRFSDAVHEVKLTIRHSKTKATSAQPSKERHNIEIIETVFATTTVAEYSRKAYLVLEALASDTLASGLVVGAVSWLLADSGAAIIMLRNWES